MEIISLRHKTKNRANLGTLYIYIYIILKHVVSRHTVYNFIVIGYIF